MENPKTEDGVVAESQVLNISTPQEKKPHERKSQKINKKWIILVIVLVVAVAPAIYILLRPSGSTTVEKNYEECVKECVSLKDTGEIDVPYGNCFEYCREGISTP